MRRCSPVYLALRLYAAVLRVARSTCPPHKARAREAALFDLLESRMVEIHRGPPRGFTTWEFATALAVVLGVALACFVVVGHALSDRDRAVHARDVADARTSMCLDGWAHTLVAFEDLNTAVDEHLASDEDRACACWVAP